MNFILKNVEMAKYTDRYITKSATPKDIQKKWFLVDADGVLLGRMASKVAKSLEESIRRIIINIWIVVIMLLLSMQKKSNFLEIR